MKDIKLLSKMIDDELDGAEEYIRHALLCQGKNPELAKTFYDISLQEMEPVNKLHKEAMKVIEEYQKEHGDPPAPMSAVYEYLHERHIEKAGEIRAQQAHFRGA